jgi:hypothetical protein
MDNLGVGSRNFGLVGAGPVGIFLSYLLVQKGHKVTLYEAGNTESETRNLNLSHYIFKTKSKIPNGVHRVGGGSNLWKRRVSEFSTEVFNRCDYSGKRIWPIDSRELENANEKLFKFLDTSGLRDNQFLDSYLGEVGEEIGQIFSLNLFRYCDENYFVNLLAELEATNGFKLVTATLVSEIRLPKNSKFDENGVELVVLGEKSDLPTSIFHSDVVLTGGCMQSTALALRSKDIIDKHPSPKNIGKFLMEHFDGYVGTVRIKKKNHQILKKLVLDEDRRIPGRDFGLGISTPRELGNRETEIAYHLELVKWRKTYLFDPNLNVFNGLPMKLYQICFFAERVLKKIPSELRNFIFRLSRTEIYSVWLKGEELPYRGSELEILTDSDPRNVKLIYNHRVSKESKILVRRKLREFSTYLEENNLGRFRIHYYFHVNRLFYTGPNFHPMGSLRMGSDPKETVVGPDFAFRGSPNVHAVNSGIFPNGSNHNPTAMVLALSLVFASKF